VVLPTYNELESLPVVLERLFAHNPQVNVLVVDDASPDGTGELADRMAKADARIQVLHRDAKNGLGAAYIAGFRLGLSQGFDYLIEMDADGSHRSEDLVKLIEASTKADLVIGSRWVRGGAVENWAWHRVALSKFGNLYARTLLGVNILDMTAGFRVFRADLLAKLIPGAVNVHGGWSPEDKADALLGFADGRIRVLITKPSIAAFGLNWQHCARMAFVGLSDSYESYYQAIRRCYRYGQTRIVQAHVVLSDLEGQIAVNIARKEREASSITAGLVAEMRAAGELTREGISA
jgi:dolichol-phosphate mannosyltransferase